MDQTGVFERWCLFLSSWLVRRGCHKAASRGCSRSCARRCGCGVSWPNCCAAVGQPTGTAGVWTPQPRANFPVSGGFPWDSTPASRHEKRRHSSKNHKSHINLPPPLSPREMRGKLRFFTLCGMLLNEILHSTHRVDPDHPRACLLQTLSI